MKCESSRASVLLGTSDRQTRLKRKKTDVRVYAKQNRDWCESPDLFLMPERWADGRNTASVYAVCIGYKDFDRRVTTNNSILRFSPCGAIRPGAIPDYELWPHTAAIAAEPEVVT